MAESDARIRSISASVDAIELRHLRSFVAVAEELNFGRAAERLYITQPALSRQIRMLERLVGCQLLQRSTRRVELTLAGEALLERARRLLGDIDDAVRAVQSLGGEIMARIAELWQPVDDELRGGSSLDSQRAAFERLLAQFDPPEGVGVRPVNAGGVPALAVGADPDVPARILYLHGGSFVLGSAFGYRPLAGALALAAERVVLVADYRLAPEHPFPAALDDAYVAYMSMLDRVGDARELIVAGDSWGAGLALALLLRLRDEGAARPGGAALLSPVSDLSASLIDVDMDDAAHEVVGRFWRGCVDAYRAGRSADEPLISPLFGDLTGLPPLLIQVAAHDVLRIESEALAERARASDVDVELELYPTDAHLFPLFWSFQPEAIDALAAAGRFATAHGSTGDKMGPSVSARERSG